jgi:hypothetical protein
MDVVDNSSDFESKIRSLISKVAWSIGIDIGDRLTSGSRKVKFVVNGPLPLDELFPDGFRDFEVVLTAAQCSGGGWVKSQSKRPEMGFYA